MIKYNFKMFFFLLFCFEKRHLSKNNVISSMAAKPITIRWIRTGSQTDLKSMYNIELQTIFL